MGAFSKIHEVLPQDFGYVALAATGGVIVNMYLAVQVSKARKEYGIEYPKMYSEDNVKFNCIQRAHQNYLEGQSTFYTLLFMSGLQHPRFTASCGGVYLLGRLIGARGYSTGDPEKRQPGSVIWHLGMFALFGGTVSFTGHLLGCFGKP